jgi:hypothetical protein
MTICILLLTSGLVNSQKLEKLNEITDEDFAAEYFQSPTILSQNFLVSFPYKQDNASAGAKDEFFTLRIESVVRIAIRKSNPVQKILGLPNTFDGDLKINSIKYYTINGTSITNRKIKESDLSLSQDDSGVYIDYSKILKDSIFIIDISYKSDAKSKQMIQFYLEKNKKYKDYTVQINIPEIFFYDFRTSNDCVRMEIKKDLNGPMIGYKPVTGPYKELQPQVIVDLFKKEFESKYEQVFCKTHLFTFRKIDSCTESNESLKEIINLKLKNITEIK